MKLLQVSALALVAAVAAACNNGGSSSPSTTAPSGTPTVEVFTGTVEVGSLDFHPFTVGQSNGVLSITLTAAGPPPTITMGLGLGTPGTNTCALVSGYYGSTVAGATPQIAATAPAGTYCVEVYDVGNQLAPITYSVTVSHY